MDGGTLASAGSGRRRKVTLVLILSYVFDWAILIAVGVVATILGNITPNKRPFSLDDPNISFPFTVHETVSSTTLLLSNTLAPAVIVAIVALVLVPGSTVPPGTPKGLIWRRKLWELHAGLLGLALSLLSAYFITNGMKNLFGKPRPDLLSRCQPDLENLKQYVVGGIAGMGGNGMLVSADICKNPDSSLLDDGFRSYPSGHSSSSAAGLIYLSLFLASKFAITLPYLPPSGSSDHASYTAFPSRFHSNADEGESYELKSRIQNEHLSAGGDPALQQRLQRHRAVVSAVRRQAAAPPLYLLLIAVLPFFAAVFIASSRWFDFRHHGFDILFGFLIGTITAFFAFRYYHLPIAQGAGWAWGPRSHDKAWWAGVGSYSYATDRIKGHYRGGDEEEALAPLNDGVHRSTALPSPGVEATAAGRKSPPQSAPRENSRAPSPLESETGYQGAGQT
ncbi:PAP2-domain-containing protein [Thozetella sp. PMI_491]|nr:PAP2-domain-containing protein [Thozetella sp. PMI_491]